MNSGSVKIYRWLVFLLALGYFLYLFMVTDHSLFGWQFRYLTIWALTTNLLVAGQMLRLSLGRTKNDWNSFVSMGIVLNVIVVVNYWKLFLTDPTALNSDGNGLIWYMEYYLHLIGPILMVFDAFVFIGAFRNVRRVCLYSVILCLAYPVWAEFLVAPMNSRPNGSVTNGLPYPFLNDLQIRQRLMFYGTIMGSNFVFIGIGWGIARLAARKKQQTSVSVTADS